MRASCALYARALLFMSSGAPIPLHPHPDILDTLQRQSSEIAGLRQEVARSCTRTDLQDLERGLAARLSGLEARIDRLDADACVNIPLDVLEATLDSHVDVDGGGGGADGDDDEGGNARAGCVASWAVGLRHFVSFTQPPPAPFAALAVRTRVLAQRLRACPSRATSLRTTHTCDTCIVPWSLRARGLSSRQYVERLQMRWMLRLCASQMSARLARLLLRWERR